MGGWCREKFQFVGCWCREKFKLVGCPHEQPKKVQVGGMSGKKWGVVPVLHLKMIFSYGVTCVYKQHNTKLVFTEVFKDTIICCRTINLYAVICRVWDIQVRGYIELCNWSKIELSANSQYYPSNYSHCYSSLNFSSWPHL